MAELFPAPVRGMASGISAVVNWSAALLTTVTFRLDAATADLVVIGTAHYVTSLLTVHCSGPALACAAWALSLSATVSPKQRQDLHVDTSALDIPHVLR